MKVGFALSNRIRFTLEGDVHYLARVIKSLFGKISRI